MTTARPGGNAPKMDKDSQTPGELTRTPLSAWWMLFILFLLYGLSYVDRIVITMLVVPIKADLHLSDVQMSLILGPAFAVFYALFGLPMGIAADRYSKRLVIFGGVTLWSLAAMGTGLARTFPALFGARMGVGVGEAALSPAAYTLLADHFPKTRLTLAMSIYQTGLKIGSAAAFSIGAGAITLTAAAGSISLPVVGTLHPWQQVLILTGAPGVLLALLVFTFPERRPKAAAGAVQPEKGAFKAFLIAEKRMLLLLALGFAMVMTAQYSLQSWMPTYLTRHFGLTPKDYGPGLSLIGLVAAFSMIAKGWFVDWLYARGMKDAHLRFYSWLVMISVPLAAGVFFIPDPAIFLMVYGALQVIAIQFVVFMASTLQLFVPQNVRGTMSGAFLAVVTIIGSSIGPLMTAVLTDHVFRDENMLGASLTVTTTASLALSLLFLRLALPRVNRIAHAQAANAAAATG